MDWKYDTPPDGDFARYVEQLTTRAETTTRRQQDQEAPPQLPAGASLWRLVRWGVMAWVGLQIVSVFVPRAGVLVLPLLLALLAWAGYSFKNAASSGALLAALRPWTKQAGKEFNPRK